MEQDILFRTERFVFSYRVAGVLQYQGKILLQKPEDDDFALIGGHVRPFETAEQALKREFAEELHAAIEVERLAAVGELFFPWGDKPCHQVSLYYRIRLEREDIPLDGRFWGYDEQGRRRTDLAFQWVPVQALEQGCKVYPMELVPYLVRPSVEVVHFVSRQLGVADCSGRGELPI